MAQLPKFYYLVLVGLILVLSGCELPRDSATADVAPVNSLPPTLAPLGGEVITPTNNLTVDVATVVPTVVNVQPVVTEAGQANLVTETIVVAVTPAISTEPVISTQPVTPTTEPVVVDAPNGNTPSTDTPAAANPPASNTLGDYAAPTGHTLYTVQSGDTLFGISQRFGVSADLILAANAMPDDIVRIGQQLIIPQTGDNSTAPSYDKGNNFYVVQTGETLFGIARQFNTTVEALISENNLTAPYMIYVGQTLTIPHGYGHQPTYTQPEYQEPSYDQPQYQPPTAPNNGTHTVGAGETLFSIAARYGTTAEALALANGLTNPNQIYVGQVLYLPN